MVVDLEEGGRRRSSSLAGLVEQAGRAEDRVDGGGGGPHRHRRKPEGAGDYCVALPQESERSGAERSGMERNGTAAAASLQRKKEGERDGTVAWAAAAAAVAVPAWTGCPPPAEYSPPRGLSCTPPFS